MGMAQIVFARNVWKRTLLACGTDAIVNILCLPRTVSMARLDQEINDLKKQRADF